MSTRFLAEDFRSIANRLKNIREDSKEDGDNTATDPLSNPANTLNNNAGPQDIEADASVNDMMTHEKGPEKLQGSIAVKNLAEMLGIKNTGLFTAAFNALRSGKLPQNQAQVRELAIAFDKLLAADASTTTKVLNQFRRIHKAS